MVAHKKRPCMQEHERLQRSCLSTLVTAVLEAQRHISSKAPKLGISQPAGAAHLFFPQLVLGRLVCSVLGVCTGMQQHQALHQQGPPEGCVPELQLGQLAAGQVLQNHALPPVCRSDVLHHIGSSMNGQVLPFQDIILAASMDKCSTSGTNAVMPDRLLYRAPGCGAACQHLGTSQQHMASHSVA